MNDRWLGPWWLWIVVAFLIIGGALFMSIVPPADCDCPASAAGVVS
ncbi:hypothetical protein BN000_00608 [Mycobacterium europaeum]|uniref:Uncharacterized protein n=1 Tax=Mycobacterium europaeum TaxID=761804 RepID=A0A0U1CX49_9MYCO|nr:solute carrier organic anion transporter [Mycobacterium europaeum]CQD03637.1 hypothetical protein BN000_00608 [Mycobacterium europaeum]